MRITDEPDLELATIFSQAARVFDIPLRQMLERRLQERVEARFAASYVARDQGYSFHAIGDFLDRHHTTIIHGVNRAKELMDVDPQYRQKVESVEQHVRPHA